MVEDYFKVYLDDEDEPLFSTKTLEEAVKEVDSFAISNYVFIKDQSGSIVWENRITAQ